jgi:hypothetical protein
VTPTSSPRLGLVVDTLDETDINTNSVNWDRVDYASGFTYTQSGVPVDPAKLFDGQLVAETDTGISWIFSGSTKRYQNYPYLCKMTANHSSGFANNVTTDNGWQVVDVARSVNATAADRDTASGGWLVPVKALYCMEWTTRWATGTTGIRTQGVSINAVRQTQWEQVDNGISNIYSTINMGKMLVWLNAGDLIRPYYAQNSGGILTCTSTFRARLIRPLI